VLKELVKVADTDVFVVGGGPAGLAAAIAARQRGLQVTVADGAAPPIDKPCGEGLMPDSLRALRELGVEVAPDDCYPFRGIRFVSSGSEVAASFPNGHGIGVRRTALHRIMVERAVAAGVCLLWKTVVTGLHPDGVFIDGHSVRSKWVVGADGGQSLVRRWAGLDDYLCRRQRFAFRQHFRIKPWTDCMELYWGRNCQLYVTRIGPEEICSAVISGDQHLRLDDALRQFPEFAARLRDAERSSTEQGAVSATCRLGKVWRRRVALVGDASGTVDAITGEGLCLAFRQSILLADCFSAGNLAPYQAAHRALGRRPAFMAGLMLTLGRHDFLRRRVMRAFNRDKDLFAKMLALHVGEFRAADFATTGIALGWGALTL
jgi:flavin-dependent dehydrogenase